MEACWALAIDWPNLSQVIGGIGQGVGALLVAGAAFLGLRTWKKQLHGTKNQALAEECLTNAYQLQYMIEDIRRPLAWHSEMDQVQALPGESEEARARRAAWGVIEVRFANHAEQYAAIAATRFKLQALLGKDARVAFETLLSSVARVRRAAVGVVDAAKILDNLIRSPDLVGDEAKLSAAKNRFNELNGIVWGYAENDPVDAKVKLAISELENRLQKLAAGG